MDFPIATTRAWGLAVDRSSRRRVLSVAGVADEITMDSPSASTAFSEFGLRRTARLLSRIPKISADDVLRRLSIEQANAIRARMVPLRGSQENQADAESDPIALDFLERVRQPTLFLAISRERPQTIAVLLSVIPAKLAPRIVRALSEERRIDVVSCLAQLSGVSQEIVDTVVAGLKERIERVRSKASQQTQGVQRVVRILQACDRQTEWSVVRSLSQDNPKLTEEIQTMLFSFEDIAGLTDDCVRTLVKNVSVETWAAAMKRASDVVRKKVTGSLSPRAAQQIHAEMDYLGTVPPSEIDRAQQRIVDVARKLLKPSDGFSDINRAA